MIAEIRAGRGMQTRRALRTGAHMGRHLRAALRRCRPWINSARCACRRPPGSAPQRRRLRASGRRRIDGPLAGSSARHQHRRHPEQLMAPAGWGSGAAKVRSCGFPCGSPCGSSGREAAVAGGMIDGPLQPLPLPLPPWRRTAQRRHNLGRCNVTGLTIERG